LFRHARLGASLRALALVLVGHFRSPLAARMAALGKRRLLTNYPTAQKKSPATAGTGGGHSLPRSFCAPPRSMPVITVGAAANQFVQGAIRARDRNDPTGGERGCIPETKRNSRRSGAKVEPTQGGK
jgi:hypothetical protein